MILKLTEQESKKKENHFRQSHSKMTYFVDSKSHSSDFNINTTLIVIKGGY